MNSIKSEDFKNISPKTNFSFFLALERLFSDIPERPKGIIEERYGIKNGGPKTLEEIGKEYKITRERVRQIIKETIKKIKKKRSAILDEINEKLRFTIKEKNDIIKEEKLLSDELESKEKGALKFFLDLFDDIVFKDIAGEMEDSWTLKDFNYNEWRKIIGDAKAILIEEQDPLTDQELFKKVKEKNWKDLDQKKFFDYVDVSAELKKGNFGKWGLKSWDEITPKGTREKIYLVLKETGKPLHFKEIAGLIDKHKLNKKKKTHPQTVHNELIRDKRFVLVGRGIYALSEWGYQKGTVKEVLEDILKKSKEPMERDEIIGKILDVRKVKKSTVLINLNNFFQKVGKNQYSVRK